MSTPTTIDLAERVIATLRSDEPALRQAGIRLRHAYDRVDVTMVWNTAKTRLPDLAAAARHALARLPP